MRPAPRASRRLLMWSAVGAVALIAVLAGSLGIARATDSPAFCRAGCHEMAPYHAAWADGPHRDVSCVECHVDQGTVARLEHKFVALGEVRAHVFGTPRFPKAAPPDVPDARCVRCHADVKVTRPGFSHEQHAQGRACQSCHAQAGHEVSTTALQQAGIYDPVASTARSTLRIAAVGQGASDVAGHVQTTCASCHVMSRTACSQCHKPPHAARGECTTCHRPGARFAFIHPKAATVSACGSCHTTPRKHVRNERCVTCHAKAGVTWAFEHPKPGADCASCHPRPAKHEQGQCSRCHASGTSWKFMHPRAGACDSCHARPAKHQAGSCARCHAAGTSWAFRHPGTGANCASCHARPAGHRSGSCARCHSAGVSWAFRHPSAGATCGSCHARPAGHRSGSCTTCHSVGSSWRFRHPSGSANCASCHARPAGHRSGSCTNCHRAGSWRFSHPGSSRCASCHGAPASHYGSSCASCHSPSRSWSSAHFNHAGIPGGEHTYRSFACSKCHPNGYSSHNCTSCHESNDGGDDD